MFRLLFVGENAAPGTATESTSEHPAQVVVGFANSVDDALAQARASDLVLVSATLPNNAALEIVRAVAKAEPHVRILVKDLAETHQAPLPFIEAGASGWLL